MTTASQLYYALWHPDGSERIVRGYAETIGFDRPWKRRAFHSISEARDWLDGVHSSRYEDKIRRLEAELERMTAERDELERLLYKERMDHSLERSVLKGTITRLEKKNKKPVMVGRMYFSSMNEAAKFLGIKAATIREYVDDLGRHYGKRCHGYEVRFANDNEIKSNVSG